MKLLPSGGLVITKPGTVISGLNITGTVYIAADNVTIENCKITAASFSVVQIKVGQTGVVIQDCEINGVGTNNAGSNGITGVGTFLRNDIYNVENGINVAAGKGTLIEGNYIHDLKASGAPHYDGIQIDGGQSDVVIRGNTVINDHDQTAAVMIDNYFGPVSNVLVTNNLLVGGGYTVYSDAQFNSSPLSNIKITDNHVGGGHWGDLNANSNSPVYTGNVKDGVALAATLEHQTGSGGGTPTEPAKPNPSESTTATEGNDKLTGDAKDNVIDGKGGNDVIDGRGGNDTIIGGAGFDTLTGGAGNDVFVFRSASEIGNKLGARDIITDFTPGQDKIDLSAIDANSKLAGVQDFTFLAGNNAAFTKTAGELAWHTEAGTGKTIVQGDTNGDGVHDFEIEVSGLLSLKASDFLGIAKAPTTGGGTPPTSPSLEGLNKVIGTAGADKLVGTAGHDYLDGKAGNDTLSGGAGNDVLYGGAGRDVMTGGAGNDVFLFKSVAEMGSTGATRDVITDFTKGQDKIDLSGVDANTKTAGDQAFTFLTGDGQSFTHKAGELAWHYEAAQNRTVIQGDTNGDGVHDFEIQLTGHIQLGAGDLVL
ncbi:M10 family metallopeptidase C-terminal domain-containing protein [Devosia sp. 2618]|uniref:M10 family metallopeptidase C-terminal domain-containing protein n=1 Tax=Devosia sp. 2618 TaxID=3156454 RepID=UPI003393C44C